MSIILFLAILVALIVIHELGHFSIAKYFGIRVDEFGVGFPPKLFGIQKGETVYSLNAIPFGGFVKIFGENPDEDSIAGPDSARSMVNKPKWVQVAVLAAGVTFNALFAWLVISLTLMIGVPGSASNYALENIKDPAVTITMVAPNSPAQSVGLMAGDKVTSLTSRGHTLAVTGVAEATDFIAHHGTSSIALTVTRAGETISTTTTPVWGIIEGKPALGIGMDMVGTVHFLPHVALWEGAKTTVMVTISITKGLGKFFLDTILFRADLTQVTGPVGIVGMVGDASHLGVTNLLMFMAFISLNLAVINLLPFPALDGGRILFVIIEKIKGSPITPVVANTLNLIGFALLILLMLVVTAHDIFKMF
jgi:regulator of sigma E protease